MILRDRLKRVHALAAAVRFVRALATPIGRGQLRAGSGLLQPAILTGMDRHPQLFALLQALLAGRTHPRLLSFGCSTGEEAFTLAHYFPHAAIDAIDANPACIAEARRAARSREHREVADRIRFLCATSPDAGTDNYDAVLCLSVLRHGALDVERPERCTALMPFARFAETVAALDRCLRPGGVLLLWGCNFRFCDTTIAVGYHAVPSPAKRPQTGPFYGADDRLLPVDSYADFVFVKSAR
ncbi:hypothetical protein ASE86_14685 [Sphingomonas sp. Leaf33]|uniref:class I SAM-dependent methyltransferase n=1 Tax=Sphingomonas sp. Leaf33 TaxID=1736215 RepID=UPI0006F6269D|nr:class I SAM-dependent methyltransferase [Sphingomonas sp. Leaf33]KQN21218.1 hypothetical protein ASE86_14685 [Sphingomonas sp. Leaf33]